MNTRTFSYIMATWFYSGKSKYMPGTCGSLAALPFAWALGFYSGMWGLLFAAAALFALGVWASNRTMAAMQKHDPGCIVIDEVVGIFITLAPFAVTWQNCAMGFILFRIFDIVKPFPIGFIDKRVKGGIGVMLDDVLAGIFAAAALYATNRWIM